MVGGGWDLILYFIALAWVVIGWLASMGGKGGGRHGHH